MSTDYYARLEQQRGPQPSPPMLASLAPALRLSADERAYQYRVAGHSTPDHVSAHEHVAPGLLRVMDRLADTPALIVSQLGEVLVQNELAKALLGASSAFSGMERSTAYRWFVHPESEQWRYPESDRQRQSHANVASLRVAYGSMVHSLQPEISSAQSQHAAPSSPPYGIGTRSPAVLRITRS